MCSQSKRRQKEIAIYEAVLCLVAQGADLSALKVQQIAEAAGIGKGTVYEYFASKDGILAGLTDYCLDGELERLTDALQPCMTLADTIDALLDYLCDLAHTRVASYRLIAQTLGHQQELVHSDGPERLKRLQEMGVALLGRLRAAGEIDTALTDDYCLFAVMAASITGTLAMSPCHDAPEELKQNVLPRLRLLLERALQPVKV